MANGTKELHTSPITIEDEINEFSEKPVQGKTLFKRLNEIKSLPNTSDASVGDMLILGNNKNPEWGKAVKSIGGATGNITLGTGININGNTLTATGDVELDTTLSVAGEAADAKATGDAIAAAVEGLAAEYDSTKTYALGDLCVKDRVLYECSTAITVAEAWNSAHWTATDVATILSRKANIDGSYDLMNTGTSDNLTPYSADSGATQSIPFIAQGTGCGNGESVVDTGSYLQFKKKLGNTVCVNQQWDESKIPPDSALYSSNTYTANGVTFTKNGDGSITIQTDNGGATALTEVKIATGETVPLTQKHLIRGAFGGSNSTYHINYAGGARKATDGSIFEPYTYGYNMWLSVESGAVITTPKKIYPQIIFLPLWFGSEGNIPSYLLSHPEDFGRYYSGSLAYNAGTLVSADGSVLTSIGRNLFDKSTAVAGERWRASGTEYASGNTRSDYIPCIPNTTYYFKDIQSTTTLGSGIYWFDADKNYISAVALNITSGTATAPSNARYVGINLPSTSLDTCCVSLYYSGESGYDQYYPYTVLASVDTGSEVLRSAGAVADEKTPDGTITRKVGVVDLGTLTWEKQGSQFRCSLSSIKLVPNYTVANLACAKYTAVTTTVITSSSPDKVIAARDASVGGLRVYDTAYSSGDAAAFKSAMSGVMVYYELATPATEQGTPFAENIPCDDFGSLIWTQTNGVPQGNTIFYPVDYKASVDTLYNRVDGDMSRIVIDDDLDDYDTATEADAKYGTKDALGGTLRQLLAAGSEIDFDNTAFVDLGEVTYNTNQTGTNTYEAATSFSVPKANGTSNFICSNLANKAYLDDGKYGIRGYGSSGGVAIRVPITVASTPEGVKAAMKGVLLAYEKASS